MNGMFYEATAFNGSVENWQTGNVTNMNQMFIRASSFNQDVGRWNTENVADMQNMLYHASAFNQYLGSWNLKSVEKFSNMLSYSGMDCANYSATLIGWANNVNTPDSISIGVHDRHYNRDAVEARDKLVDLKGWEINGDRYVTACGGLNNIWIGTNSTNWGDPGNWLGNQTPPSAVDADIEFATVENNNGVAAQNNLKLDYNRHVGKFANSTDKALIIPAGMSLTVNGTLSGSETPEKVNNIQILASDKKPNGALILAGQPADTPVYGIVQMYSRAYKGNERTWTDNINGSPTNGKTFKSSYRWQHFGIPVETILADTTFYGAFIREYDETYNGDNTTFFNKWRKVHNSTILYAFKGYEITRQSPNYYFIRGKFMFGDKQLTMTRKAPLVTGATNPDNKINHWGLGQNIFGNSYTASININKMEFPSEVESTVYIYNTGSFADWANTGNNTTTTNIHHIPGTYLAIPQNLASIIWNNRIPSMQGFLLKFKDEETVFNRPDATVTLKYATEGVLPNTQLQKVADMDTTANYLGYLQITLSGEQPKDVMWLVETPLATDRFDNGYDGHKLVSMVSSASIFTDVDGKPLQISSSRSIVGDVFSFRSDEEGIYSLDIVKSGLERYANLYLLDLATKNAVPLTNDTTVYQFTANNADKVEKRFMIVDTFDTTTDIENNPNVELLDAYMSYNNKTLIVNNMTSSAGSITILDISGRAVAYSNMNIGFSQIPVNLQAGVYMVLMKASNRVKNIKVVVK
ncbi:hypothetical protein HW49_08685 [Porphyromonadaceae bacterium COT-184 OH4590]|nr:hypothetical protein HW49_08685 [Porphyromonadaceae bacterium COT-184 OH4590]